MFIFKILLQLQNVLQSLIRKIHLMHQIPVKEDGIDLCANHFYYCIV